MLTIFRRHTARCTAKRPEYDRTYRKCKCLIHVEGKIGDRFLRESLKTRSWEQANRRVAEAEARGTWEELPEQRGTAVAAHASEDKRVSIAHAVAEYLQNAVLVARCSTMFGHQRLDHNCKHRECMALGNSPQHRTEEQSAGERHHCCALFLVHKTRGER